MKRTALSLVALVATAFSASCATTGLKPWPPPQPSDAPVVFILFRSQCEGDCDSYRISVRADGLVEYEGLHRMREMGRRWTMISAEQVDALIKLDFEDLRGRGSVEWITTRSCEFGLPTITVAVIKDEKARATCGSPKEFVALEEQALGTLRGQLWVQ